MDYRVLKLCGIALGLTLTVSGRGAETVKTQRVLTPESQKTYEQKVVPFLKTYCWKCHDENSAKAGFQVDTLGADFLAGKTADHWREAIDQINLGKMPKQTKKPDPRESFAVVEWVNQELRNAEKRAQSTGGRVPMRRLNRTEYANTVRDLLHLDENFARKVEQELPTDGKVDGFDRGGAGLLVDKSQLQSYLDVARLVVDEALPPEKPKVNLYHHLAAKDRNHIRPIKKTTTMKEILVQNQVFSNIYTKEAPKFEEIERGPEINDFAVVRDGGVEFFACAPFMEGLAYFERGVMPSRVVTRDGWYRVRIRAGAFRGSGKYAVDAVRIEGDYCRQSKENRASFTITVDAPLDLPKVYEQLVFLRYGSANFEKVLNFRWNMYQARNDKEQLIQRHPEMWADIQAVNRTGDQLTRLQLKNAPAAEMEAARKKRDDAYETLRQFSANFKGPVYHVNPDIDFKALPRLWYEYVDLEGPIVPEWPTQATKELFFNGEQGDAAYARQIFARFLPRAYRRPVSAVEIEDMVASVRTMQAKHGRSFAEAVRASVVSVLSSPDFLYLQEPTGADSKPHELTDHELASRLSYLLWSTMPDAELLDLAARKKLRDPAVLRGQVKRMAADPRARQFVENFVGQWMRVRDFDTVIVENRYQYKEYDEALKTSGLREPYEFFHELLRADLSVLNLLDSDFLVVNQRLAKHYGIAGVEGEQFRRVPIKPEQRRGGILGMAGLLTYLSDGTRTLPVKRGAYVLDVLWNTPAPLPPPDAGNLPVIKGKRLTVRQRLEQHRSVATCASCHAKIDPLGLGLENYDAIGAWRERQNGEGRRGDKNDPPIDASGVMPGGKAFKTLPEFKQALMAEKAKFLKGFTERLMAYALGRPVGVTDRETVEKIMAQAAREDYRLQAFLQALAADRVFQTK